MWIPFEVAMSGGSNLTWLNGLTLPLLFVMIHDGVYYETRKALDKVNYKIGFFGQSTTSTAWADRMGLTKPYLRIAYFLIGITALIIINK
jgi:hypothetical protein